MIAELDESARALDESLAGVSEEAAAQRLDPARWSVLECVEHLVLTERGMLKRIASSPVAEPLAGDPARGIRVGGAMVNRSVQRESPASVRPTGRFATLSEARTEFDAARGETLIFVEKNAGDLTMRTISHPFFGLITGADMVLIMAGHVRRHADQIREIRAGLES